MHKGNVIIVKAKISLKSAAEGGRHEGLYTGFRPNHVFEMPKEGENLCTFVGEVQFTEKEKLLPGESVIATVTFIDFPILRPYIKPGQKWFINQAITTFGYGEILEIIEMPK